MQEGRLTGYNAQLKRKGVHIMVSCDTFERFHFPVYRRWINGSIIQRCTSVETED